MGKIIYYKDIKGGNKMPSVYEVADYFRFKTDYESGSFLTHLKLQKLVYYAQAWHLVFYKTRLFDGEFEAWAHGPVEPRLYSHYSWYSYHELPSLEELDATIFSKEQQELLNEVWENYGKFDGKYLEDLTHSEPPWIKARGNCTEGERCNTAILDDEIIKYYSSLLDEQN